jgi:hypothetical protein
MFGSIKAAQDEIEILTEARLKMEMQLGDPCRLDSNMQKIETGDYMIWRKKAKTALFHTDLKIRAIHKWINDQRDKMLNTHFKDIELNLDSSHALLTAAYTALKGNTETLTVNDLLLLDGIERHLERHSV